MRFYRPLASTVEEQRQWAAGAAPRIPTGYPIMDDLTNGGAAPGEVVMVLARSGVGKTIIGCNIAVNNRGVPTVFFSLEMAGRFLVNRLAAIWSDTPTALIEQQLRDGQPCAALDALVSGFPELTVIDEPGMGLSQMSEALDEVEAEWGHRPRLVIIDYLELIKAPGATDGVTQVDKVSRKLKDFARSEEVVVVVLHQVNKGGGEGDQPLTRHDARYGGDVAADYTLAAYRPCLEPGLTMQQYQSLEPDFYMQFLKTRGGPRIHPQGVRYHLNVDSLKISVPRLPGPPAYLQETF
jgi:hypothetical protein